MVYLRLVQSCSTFVIGWTAQKGLLYLQHAHRNDVYIFSHIKYPTSKGHGPMSKITLPIILFPHDFLNCGKAVDLVKTGKAVASTLAAAIVWIKAQ